MTEYITPTTWEQCAAHVEAGGVVEIEDAPGVWINDRAAATTYRGRCGTPDDGWAPRRLVPIESAAPANGVPAVPTGAERYLAERLADPEYRAAYEAAAPVTGDDLRDAVHLLDLAWGVIANADGWNDDTSWRQAAERWRDGYHRLLDDIRTTAPAPPPVPPWPGAVLSGLTDEDGVPTWLAQAGQVRGEQVRRRSDFVWVNNDQMVAHLDTVWVEVRAPRAVPEPETERVPWWEAVGRRWTDGRVVWKVTHSVDGVIAWDKGGEALDVMFSADGTVEVLKDGDL